MQESVLRVAVFFRSKEFKHLRAELHPEMKRQPAVHDMRVECLQRQLALEQQEQNHALCKQGHYVAEGGGESQLDRAYRMESPQAIETVLCLFWFSANPPRKLIKSGEASSSTSQLS